MSYFNTISLEGKPLEIANGKAALQEDLVLEIFKANPGVLISPSQMLNVFKTKYKRNVPITSIRRAMTNLTNNKKDPDKDKKLIKTASQTRGLYNYNEHYWVLNTPEETSKQQVIKQEGTTAGDHAIKLIQTSDKYYQGNLL